MQQKRGDIWSVTSDAVVVTTNGIYNSNGAIMGGGTARQAADRYPQLRQLLADKLRTRGNHVFSFKVGESRTIITMPTKGRPEKPSSILLIERSANELVKLVNKEFWTKIVLPRPGCGLGGLEWKEVYPVIAPILDDRFVVISND